MATFRLSRTVLKPIRFELWQPGEVAPVDCTGFTASIEETTLPWTPGVTVISAALGQFEIAAPSSAEAAQLRAGTRYGIKVVWRDGAAKAVESFDLTLVAD